MRTLVIYDSYYGNTGQLAAALGETLSGYGEAEVKRAAEVTPDQIARWDLIIVACPTRKFTASPAVKHLLKHVPKGSLKGVRAASCDTRVDVTQVSPAFLKGMIRVFGYAAEKNHALLMKKGAVPASTPQGFYVEGTEGPMREGELDRASAWAKTLAQ